MGGEVLTNRSNGKEEVLAAWQVGKLQKVAHGDLPLTHKVCLGPEHRAQGVLHHPNGLVDLHLQGATTAEGEDYRLGSVFHLAVEVAGRGNTPVLRGVHRSQVNILEDQ